MSDITTIQTPLEKFNQQLADRIRKDIGELLPDEVLKDLIHKSVEDLFFKEKTRPGVGWNTQPVVEPPGIQKVIEPLLKEVVRQEVQSWMSEHHEEVLAQVKDRLDAGLASALVNALDSIFRNQMISLEGNITSMINQLRNR